MVEECFVRYNYILCLYTWGSHLHTNCSRTVILRKTEAIAQAKVLHEHISNSSLLVFPHLLISLWSFLSSLLILSGLSFQGAAQISREAQAILSVYIVEPKSIFMEIPILKDGKFAVYSLSNPYAFQLRVTLSRTSAGYDPRKEPSFQNNFSSTNSQGSMQQRTTFGWLALFGFRPYPM